MVLGICAQGQPPAEWRDSPRDVSPTIAAVTGPREQIEAVAGAEATMKFMLLPVATYPPDGVYNTGGLYDESDISGEHDNVLTIHSGPGRVFLNLFLSDWDPDYAGDPDGPVTRLRLWQADLAFRYPCAPHDCYGWVNGVGEPLNPGWSQLCANDADCQAASGESGSYCGYGFCSGHWINKPPAGGRPDGIQNELIEPTICQANYWEVANCVDPCLIFFGVTDPAPCGLVDAKPRHYAGSLVIDVPAGARGTYTIEFAHYNSDALDDSEPESQPIPIAAFIPAIIRVVGDDCNENAQHDTDDIALGLSEDINGDGIPDSCQAIPTSSEWGLTILTLSLLILAKVTAPCTRSDNL